MTKQPGKSAKAKRPVRRELPDSAPSRCSATFIGPSKGRSLEASRN